jgi:hypothetical protein
VCKQFDEKAGVNIVTDCEDEYCNFKVYTLPKFGCVMHEPKERKHFWACVHCGKPSDFPVCDDCGRLPVEDRG